MRTYLKDAREHMGYTQQYVAKQIGISQNYYCDIENGVRQKELRSGMLSKLSSILNIPIQTMLTEEEKLQRRELDCG